MNEGREQALRHIVEIAARHGLGTDEIAAAMQAAGRADPVERSGSVVARVLAYIGAVLVLAGVSLFVGMKWEIFNAATRVLITLGTGFAVYLFALACARDARFEKAVTPLMLIAALLQPTGIMVMLDEYARGGKPEHGVLFMCSVMFLQQFLTFLGTRRTVLLFSSLVFGAAGFGLACDLLGVDETVIAIALGVGLSAIAWTVDRGVHRAVAPLAYFAGSAWFLAGMFDLVRGTALEISFFGMAAAVMYLATVLRSRTLLFVSVVALISFTGYYFRDSLANAFGLIVMGLLLIGLSGFAMSLSRKYIGRRRDDSLPGDLRENASD